MSFTPKPTDPYTRVLSVKNNSITSPLPYSTGSASNTITCTNTPTDPV